MATQEITEDIDYSELEKLFSADTQEVKKPNVGMNMKILSCYMYMYMYVAQY